MTFVYLICFLLLAVGAVLLLKLTPERITGDLMRFVSPKQTLRDKVLTRKLSMALLFCFMLVYVVVIGQVLLSSLGGMFG